MNMQRKRNSGFSLTEVLMAAGILAMGFMMVLTLFPLGLKITAVNTERTMSMLASGEALFNVPTLIKTFPSKLPDIPANRYVDLRSIFWTDRDSDKVIDDREADFTAVNGDYELEYDPYLFLYPTASNVVDEDKKYNCRMLIGQKVDNYAELIVFTCRRVGTVSLFPLAITADLTNPDYIGNRPSLLSLDTDSAFSYDTVPGSWIKISDDHKDVLDAVGLAVFVASEADIVVNRQQRSDMFGIKVVGIEHIGDEYFVVADRDFSKHTRRTFDKIWFVPPAIGAARSAAVNVSRQTIRVNYE